MKQILVTANDTGVGKTWASAALVRRFHGRGDHVGYVKLVETGLQEGERGDADFVQERNPEVSCETLLSFAEPLAPLSAASHGGFVLGVKGLLEEMNGATAVDVRVMEGAGGIAVPVDSTGLDWLSFAQQASVDFIVLVVEDRLGAINQARLAVGYLDGCGIPAGLWLNCVEETCETLRTTNLEALSGLKTPIFAVQGFGEQEPDWRGLKELKQVLESCEVSKGEQDARGIDWRGRISRQLEERRENKMDRELRVHEPRDGMLNLADNNYLRLSHHPKVKAAAQEALVRWGCSASASPLVTGWLPVHQQLERRVCNWHGFPHGMLWNSGFQANRSILSMLPQRGDLVLADRLVHRSMISGILESGAQFRRYRHLDLEHLQSLLDHYSDHDGDVYVLTESVFSMDGDSPDLQAMADLKERHGFVWMVDEAHALGWYGERGSGLVETFGVGESVDILVGTLGKALGAQGAYTLFREASLRDYLVNFSEDFIYSTFLAPSVAASAMAAVEVVKGLYNERLNLQAESRLFRDLLREVVPSIQDGDSPIVPLVLGDVGRCRMAHQSLIKCGILGGFIRPPTVPMGTGRLRLSLKTDLDFRGLAEKIKSCLVSL